MPSAKTMIIHDEKDIIPIANRQQVETLVMLVSNTGSSVPHSRMILPDTIKNVYIVNLVTDSACLNKAFFDSIPLHIDTLHLCGFVLPYSMSQGTKQMSIMKIKLDSHVCPVNWMAVSACSRQLRSVSLSGLGPMTQTLSALEYMPHLENLSLAFDGVELVNHTHFSTGEFSPEYPTIIATPVINTLVAIAPKLKSIVIYVSPATITEADGRGLSRVYSAAVNLRELITKYSSGKEHLRELGNIIKRLNHIKELAVVFDGDVVDITKCASSLDVLHVTLKSSWALSMLDASSDFTNVLETTTDMILQVGYHHRPTILSLKVDSSADDRVLLHTVGELVAVKFFNSLPIDSVTRLCIDTGVMRGNAGVIHSIKTVFPNVQDVSIRVYSILDIDACCYLITRCSKIQVIRITLSLSSSEYRVDERVGQPMWVTKIGQLIDLCGQQGPIQMKFYIPLKDVIERKWIIWLLSNVVRCDLEDFVMVLPY